MEIKKLKKVAVTEVKETEIAVRDLNHVINSTKTMMMNTTGKERVIDPKERQGSNKMTTITKRIMTSMITTKIISITCPTDNSQRTLPQTKNMCVKIKKTASLMISQVAGEANAKEVVGMLTETRKGERREVVEVATR